MFELPDGYREIRRVTVKDKVVAIVMTAASALVLVLVVALGWFIQPRGAVSEDSAGEFTFNIDLLTTGVLLVAAIVYFVAHEGVHGLFVRLLTGRRARYGFAGIALYTASDAYSNRREFSIIAAAPTVVFTTLFLALAFLLPSGWFWPVWVLQAVNLSGSVGDIYLIITVLRAPKDVLTHDQGAEMVLYSKTG